MRAFAVKQAMLVGKVADGAQEMQPDADSWEKALAVGFEHFQLFLSTQDAQAARMKEKRRQTKSKMPLCVFLVLRR